jgi:hypothetical protein
MDVKCIAGRLQRGLNVSTMRRYHMLVLCSIGVKEDVR